MASNDLDVIAEERQYEEQELGAKFDQATGKRMYDQYQVLRVLPKSEEDLSVLRFLEKGLLNLYFNLLFSHVVSIE